MADTAGNSGVNRREALKLISAVAALGAGLSVGVNTADAATEATQLQFKFYGAKDDLLHSLDLPADISQKLIKLESVQVKLYQHGSKDHLAQGSLVMQTIKHPDGR